MGVRRSGCHDIVVFFLVLFSCHFFSSRSMLELNLAIYYRAAEVCPSPPSLKAKCSLLHVKGLALGDN